MDPARLPVLKTYKLYIGGKFPRSESGRIMTARQASTGKHLAHFAHASRKDLRDAVVAARSAFSGWSSYSASLRGQILYRAAEVIEGRSDSFAREISDLTGDSLKQSKSEVEAAVDALVYFAGWTDKYSQVFSSVNPVASAHFNFSFPEPTGVVGIVSPNEPLFSLWFHSSLRSFSPEIPSSSSHPKLLRYPPSPSRRRLPRATSPEELSTSSQD